MSKRQPRCPKDVKLPDGKRVLTLDIASAVGYAYGAGGTVVRYGKHTSEDDAPLGRRLHNFSQWLSKVIHGLPEPPDIVVIEQPYLGRNPKTHAILNRYIGVAQREIFRILKLDCEFMSPATVKKLLKFPPKKTHEQYKRLMVKKVNEVLGLQLCYKPSRTHKTKQSDDDIADAIGLLFAYWLKNGIITDL